MGLRKWNYIFVICVIILLSALFFIFSNESEIIHIKKTHPRIWVDESGILDYKKRAGSVNPQTLLDYAFMFLIKESPLYLEKVKSKLEILDFANANALCEAAIAYDWCYKGFTLDERTELEDKLISAAAGIMNNKRLFRSFHNIMYENTAAVGITGIALYSERKEAVKILRFARREYKDAVKVFENIFQDGDWPEGCVYARHVNLAACKYLLAVDSAMNKNLLGESSHFKNLARFIMYSAYPDNTVYNGSDNDYPYLKSSEKLLLHILSWKFNDGYSLSFLKDRLKDINYPYMFCDILWPLENIEERSFAGLPKAVHFRGTGLVLARSGWGKDAAVFGFKCGDYYGDHSHYDINSFTIWKNGPLAIDSGLYDAAGWDLNDLSNSHLFNYYQRAIAHNTVLIYDKDEKFSGYENAMLSNDGGQKVLLWNEKGAGDSPADYSQTAPAFGKDRTWVLNPGKWETGSILEFKQTQDYCYIAGDGTKAYNSKKLKKFIREFLVIYPDIVLIYDKIKTAGEVYSPLWLIHCEQEPVIKDNSVLISNGKSILRVLNILPAGVSLEKTGGKGYEYYVNGVNYSTERTSVNPGETPGKWRVEISAPERTDEYEFLNILFIGAPKARLPYITKNTTSENITLEFVYLDNRYAVNFSRVKNEGSVYFESVPEQGPAGKGSV